ncbi:lysylphosphatidylglycerol synthase transmembrane domain-containing protein [Allohahella marinimesophila]|uniref:lysylphosphatidylglycerol synthase transmembrane domain-containing protein n=1 Tax=Allohahella marinimesophila TaxID=1054972 RepID=UPI0031D88A49
MRIALTVAAVILVLELAPLREISTHLASTELSWLWAALFLQVLIRVITAARMQLLAHFQRLSLSFWVMLRIVLATAFYGLFLPGGIAGGAVTFVKYRQYGAGGAAALTNVVVNKAIAALTIGFLTCTAWLADFVRSQDATSPALNSLIALLSLLTLLLLPFLLKTGINAFGLAPRLQHRYANGHGRFSRAAGALLSQMQILNDLGWRQTFVLIFAGCAAHVIGAAGMLFFGLALGLSIDLISVMWIYGMVFLLALLPISFANVGVREASMILLLAPFGIGAAEATAWSVLMYSGPLAAALAGALLEATAFADSPLPIRRDQ